jgi:DNA invertase Pin-like site-specific DNA recombinase
MTVREMGRLGGLSRAAQYGSETLRQWSAKGGVARRERHTRRELRAFAANAGRRPYKLIGKHLKRLREMLAKGKSHAEISRQLGISLRTIGRYVANERRAASPHRNGESA